MKAYPGTQAVLRAVALLKAFTPERPRRGLAELARELGLHKTTAYRLLTALESEGMVERAPGGEAYRLGPELAVMGALAQGSRDLRGAARVELQGLAQQTRETATVEILVGSEVVILDEAMGGHVVGTMPSVGTRWPAHATSTGKALLAELPEPEREDRLGSRLARRTPRTIASAAALERELARVRERGYATSIEELEAGFVAVGAPVRSAHGAVVAALSVGGPRARLTPERMEEVALRVRAAAARVSERLGYRTASGAAGPLAAAPAARKGRR